jgi:signal transduction histidine kinase
MKKAVEEEVKSQRMKTELITNVSHDLKTPLTAITTYIELLKKEDITEEERRSYIDTLERKSLRLKVLIEDLFEVSKANSNNIVLNKMELDVVNLIKQVSIEHVDKMKERGLELKWNVPEEKVLLMLDNQNKEQAASTAKFITTTFKISFVVSSLKSMCVISPESVFHHCLIRLPVFLNCFFIHGKI